jgi:hypothetical protein
MILQRSAQDTQEEGKRTEGRKARKGGSYKCNTATAVGIAAECGCTQVPQYEDIYAAECGFIRTGVYKYRNVGISAGVYLYS